MSTNNTQDLQDLISGMVSDILRASGVSISVETYEDEPEEEAECDEIEIPAFVVSVNGTIVSEPVADVDELKEVILAIASANPQADVQIYAQLDIDDIL